MNKVLLTGHLATEPEVKTLDSGKKVVSFRMRVAKKDKERTGMFFTITAWGTNADFVGKYFKNGDPVEVNGHLNVREWEKDGEKKSVVEVIVDELGFVPTKKTDRPASAQESNIDDMFA